MLCPNPKCRNENPDGSKFCNKCGTSLAFPVLLTCFKCNMEIKEGSVFCNHCGAALTPKIKKAKEIMSAVKKWLPEQLKENKWLVASIAALMGSFAVATYFIQFCVAAGIFGGMWIYDRAKRELLIRLYRAWKNKDEEKVEILVAELKNKISTDGRSITDSAINIASRIKKRFHKK